MAAVNYGPALKTTSGFGFLNPVGTDLFQPMATGVELAKGLDQCLLENEMPVALTSLKENLGTEHDALHAFEGWNIATPSEHEQVAFRAVFYDGSPEESALPSTDLGLRSATFDLILSILKAAEGPVQVEALRELMFLGAHALPQAELSIRARAARKRWILLQVRQAQRLAMEALLSWIEKRILYDGAKHTSDLATVAVELCANSADFQDRDWLKFAENRVGRSLDNVEDAVRVAVASEELSILNRMGAVGQHIREESDDILPAALALLGLCREYTGLLEQIPELRAGLRFGGTEGLSLALWWEICDRTKELTVHEFVLMVIEELVLSRHFAVATRRYDGNVIRLRITIGEDGLVALVSKPWRPAPAQDKLASGLSLMADCGLIARVGAGYTFQSP
jgi:hypothetical protein